MLTLCKYINDYYIEIVMFVCITCIYHNLLFLIFPNQNLKGILKVLKVF